MKKIILTLFALILLLIPAGRAYGFDPLSGPCSQSGAQSTPICQQNTTQQTAKTNENPVAGPNGVLQTVTNVMAVLTGIVAVVMIIISGMQFVTAGGSIAGQRAGDNPSKAKKARANLMAAIIGLIIVALAWTIITFVVQKIVQ